MQQSAASIAHRPSVADLVGRAREIVPVIRARAAETEANRRVSDEVALLLREAGLFRIVQPAEFGGYELGFDGVLAVGSEVGRACGSTAWIYSVMAVAQWIAASLPAAGQAEVWADNSNIIAGSFPPTCTTTRVDGGYCVSGKWAFASGCDVAQWLCVGAMAPPPAGDTGAPKLMMLHLPRGDVKLEDDWHTMGLAGTGSKTIVAQDLFIPAHRGVAVADLIVGNGPGTQLNTSPLYRQSFLSVLPVALVAAVMGMAEGALEEFVDGAKVRSTRGAVSGSNRRMADFAGVQTRVAEARASIDAARLLLQRDLAEVAAVAERGEPTPIAIRMRNRLDHAFSAKLLMAAIDNLFNASGGQGIQLSKPLQRFWRDAHAATSHLSLNWDAVSTMYGQYALGLEPQGQY